MQTQTVSPIAEVALGHRAYYVRTSASGYIAAASREGTVSVAGPDRDLIGKFEVSGAFHGLSLTPERDHLALCLDSEVRIVSHEGHSVCSLPSRPADAWFDADGNLWLVEPSDDKCSFAVSVRKQSDLDSVHARIVLEDPFGESALYLPSRPMRAPLPLWVAAGQDGQVVVWLDFDDSEISENLQDEFEQCCPPEVSPTSEEFLLPLGTNELRRYDLYSLEQLAELRVPGETYLINGATYLDESEVLITIEDGPLFRVDLSSMTIVAQVEIAGHEMRETRELYPGLDDTDLSSDLVQVLLPGCGKIVSVHTVLPDPKHRQHSVLVWW